MDRVGLEFVQAQTPLRIGVHAEVELYYPCDGSFEAEVTMFINRPALIDGEIIKHERGVNFIITISNYGLSRFCADGLMWVNGMKDKEAIGGKLFLTNYRVIFSSHRFNRLVGEFSIPLSIIRRMRNKSKLWIRKLSLSCSTGDFEFIMFGVDNFIARTQNQIDDLDISRWNAILSNEKRRWSTTV